MRTFQEILNWWESVAPARVMVPQINCRVWRGNEHHKSKIRM